MSFNGLSLSDFPQFPVHLWFPTGALYQRPQAATPDEREHLSLLGGLSSCSVPCPTGVHPNIPTQSYFC